MVRSDASGWWRGLQSKFYASNKHGHGADTHFIPYFGRGVGMFAGLGVRAEGDEDVAGNS